MPQQKVVLVTGAGGGIGRAIVEEFVRAGLAVVAVDSSPEGLDQLDSELRSAGASFRVFHADVSVSAEVESYVRATLSDFGRIDVLVNNAAIEGRIAPVADYPLDVFDRVIAINLRGALLNLKHVLPTLVEKRSGAVVNMSSTAGNVGAAGLAAYVASKHALLGVTKVAAAEVGPFGVRVNAVCPGPVETRMMRALEAKRSVDTPGAPSGLIGSVPLGRYGTTAEVAKVVAFLASDACGFVNGAAWLVDGGLLAAV